MSIPESGFICSKQITYFDTLRQRSKKVSAKCIKIRTFVTFIEIYNIDKNMTYRL